MAGRKVWSPHLSLMKVPPKSGKNSIDYGKNSIEWFGWSFCSGQKHKKVGISDGVDVLKSAACPLKGLNVV